jgi:prenylcysteine alpha-carboxyl methylesterase
MRRGFVVASVDYRNFPQGTVGDMVQDVSSGIGWVRKRAASLGGDPTRVFVVGQSAGAHLSACAVLRQSEWARDGVENAEWRPSQIAGFAGISGVYAPDDPRLIEHFHAKGLYREVFYSIMEAGFSGSRAEEALPRASPAAILRELIESPGGRSAVAEEHPPVLLCHGRADTSAPPRQSETYAEELRRAGVRGVTERYYEGKTHTDPFVTDPISGGGDALLEDLVAFVGGDAAAERVGPQPAMLPRALVEIARAVVPF